MGEVLNLKARARPAYADIKPEVQKTLQELGFNQDMAETISERVRAWVEACFNHWQMQYTFELPATADKDAINKAIEEAFYQLIINHIKGMYPDRIALEVRLYLAELEAGD